MLRLATPVVDPGKSSTMKLTYFLISLGIARLSLANYSDKVYRDLVHYAGYCKLTACISKPDKLHQDLPFRHGGCSLRFCKKEHNSDATITRIREAPADETGTAFTVVDSKNQEIIIGFRASVTTLDWISDFMISLVDYEPISKSWKSNVPKCVDCKVHSGFYRNLDSITEELVNYVTELYTVYPVYRLIIVGHSLGGALLTLCGIEFRLRGFKPTVFTYASPKWFNTEMVHWVNNLFNSESLAQHLSEGGNFKTGLIRVVHDEDYVPMLPPKLGQAGVEFFIDKKNLPHTKDAVQLTGVDYLYKNTLPLPQQVETVLHQTNQNASTLTYWEWLHGYEHETYFMTINKCDDVDQVLED